MNPDKFETNFWRSFGIMLVFMIAFYTSIIVIIVLALRHFGIL